MKTFTAKSTTNSITSSPHEPSTLAHANSNNGAPTIQSSLSVNFPIEEGQSVTGEMILKISERLIAEFDYLKQHHLELFTKYFQAFNFESSASLEVLNWVSSNIDKINAEVIKKRIDTQSSVLNLRAAKITRIPHILINDAEYKNYWETVTELQCQINLLQTLNLQRLTALQKLYCSNNQLISLNLQGLTVLQTLGCFHNKLTTLDLRGLTALKGLVCDENQLTSLNLQGLTKLEELFCSHNRLTSLNLHGLVALRSVSCEHNYLQTLPEQVVKIYGELAKIILQTQKPITPPLTFQFNNLSISSSSAPSQPTEPENDIHLRSENLRPS